MWYSIIEDYSVVLISLAIAFILNFILELASKTPEEYEEELNDHLVTRNIDEIIIAQ